MRPQAPTDSRLNDQVDLAPVSPNIGLLAVDTPPRTPAQGPPEEHRARAGLLPGWSVRHDVAMLVRPGSLDDLPGMAAVFHRAVLTNEGDRDLLFDHPELTVLEPPAEDDVVLVAEVTARLVGFAIARALGDDTFTGRTFS